MTRLVLTVLIVAALVALTVQLGRAVATALTAPLPQIEEGKPVQKLAFALLVALMLYVAVQGGSA